MVQSFLLDPSSSSMVNSNHFSSSNRTNDRNSSWNHRLLVRCVCLERHYIDLFQAESKWRLEPSTRRTSWELGEKKETKLPLARLKIPSFESIDLEHSINRSDITGTKLRSMEKWWRGETFSWKQSAGNNAPDPHEMRNSLCSIVDAMSLERKIDVRSSVSKKTWISESNMTEDRFKKQK